MEKNKKTIMTNETNFIQKAQIKCPKCFALFFIPEPEIPRDVRCGICKFTFQVGAEKISVVYSNDTKDYLSKDTVALAPPKKSKSETVDDANSTFEINSNYLINETLNAGESPSLRSFLKLKGLTPKAYLSQSTTIDGENEDSTKYIYGKEIGRGGMGAIISTHDVDTRRNIVTKILLRTASKKTLLRFIEEAQITAQLEHPNIVPIYEIGVNKDGDVYYTMQHVKGDSLQKIINQSESELQSNNSEQRITRFLQILVEVSNAVAFAHSKKVIHRDLKPDNIMIGEYGEVILMDFGLAKILTNVDPEEIEELIDVVTSTRTEFDDMITLEGDIAGTPKYMAPEQANGDIKDQDEQTDVYALGAILFACIAKKAPIPGNSVHDVLQNVIEGRKLPLPESTASELVAIINKAMAVDKINRYKTVLEFSSDLKLYLQGYSISAKEDHFGEVCIKLIRRNKQAFLISLIAFIIMLVFGVLAIQEIIKKKEEAENNLNKFISAQKLAKQEKQDKENLQKEKIKQWKFFYQEDFKPTTYELIPERPDDYRYGDWGVHKGLVGFSKLDLEKNINSLKHKVWLEGKQIHFSVQNNGYLYLNQEVFGNIRIDTTVTCISGNSPEISLYLCGSHEKQELEGYTLAIGSKLKFQKGGKTIFEQELALPLQLNIKQHIIFERSGNQFKFYLNNMDQPVFNWEDPDPIYGEKNSICGFYVWQGEIAFESLNITKLTWAKQNSPMDFVDRLRRLGQDKLAVEEYKEIIFSTDEILEKAEAFFELGTTYKNLGMINDAKAVFNFFINKQVIEKYSINIPFEKANKLINKSYVFLFLIALDENLEALNNDSEKLPSSFEQQYKDVVDHCKNDDSLEIIFNYIVTKIINKNMNKEGHIRIFDLLKSLISNMNAGNAQICNKVYSELLFNFSLLYHTNINASFGEYLLSEAININSKDDKYIMQRGMIRTKYFADEKKMELGLQDFYTALEINPSNINSYNQISNYFLAKKQFDKSLKIIKQGLVHNPNSYDLNLYLANNYLDSRQYALFDLQLVFLNSLRPNATETNRLLAYSYYLRNQINELEALLAPKNNKKFHANDITFFKGIVLLNSNKHDEAIEIFTNLAKENTHQNAISHLALAYSKKGEDQKVVDTLLKAKETKLLDKWEQDLLNSSLEKLKEKK